MQQIPELPILFDISVGFYLGFCSFGILGVLKLFFFGGGGFLRFFFGEVWDFGFLKILFGIFEGVGFGGFIWGGFGILFFILGRFFGEFFAGGDGDFIWDFEDDLGVLF